MKITANIINGVHPKKKLNILTHVVHEGFDYNICNTGHEFWAIPGEHVRPWGVEKRPIPNNYHIMDSLRCLDYIDFDVILNGNPLAHYNNLKPISLAKNIPIINIWHTMQVGGWSKERWADSPFKHDTNVFITPANHIMWGPGQLDEPCHIIDHGIDSDLFIPLEKKTECISIVNDFRNRSQEYNLPCWQYISQGLPVTLIGDNPGLSKPATSFEELRKLIGEAKIFLGTATISPFSMSYLEAMSCGCAMVVAATCSVPDYLDDSCAFLFSPHRPQDGRDYLINLMSDKDMAAEFGAKARERAKTMTMEGFVNKWNNLLMTF
jgi:hypothetical protein